MNKLTIIIPQTTKHIQKVRNIAFFGADFYEETWLTTLSQLLALSFSTLHILQHVVNVSPIFHLLLMIKNSEKFAD